MVTEKASKGCTTWDCLFCMCSHLELTAEADGNWLHKGGLFFITQIDISIHIHISIHTYIYLSIHI